MPLTGPSITGSTTPHTRESASGRRASAPACAAGRLAGLLLLGAVVTAALDPTVGAATIDVPADYPTIQQAIDAAVDGDLVLVHPNTYHEKINFWGKAIEVRSTGGAAVTIIDADQSGSVVTLAHREGPGTILRGFTITGGTGTNTHGGGIRCSWGSPTIADCVITDNHTYEAHPYFNVGGAGVYTTSSANPTILRCTITNNTATDDAYFQMSYGGGVWAGGGTFVDCVISDNWATGAGGGVAIMGSASLIGCTLTGNVVHGKNGGYAQAGSAIECFSIDHVDILIERCDIHGNEQPGQGYTVDYTIIDTTSTLVIRDCLVADNIGSGLLGGYAQASVINSTITRNDGFGVSMSGAVILNSIIWNNTGTELEHASGATYCDIEGGFPGTGNIDADPMFVDPLAGDYRLAAGSPCIDTGDESYVPVVDGVRDLQGNSRLLDGDLAGSMIADMGACEHTNLRLAVTGEFHPGGHLRIEETGEPALTVFMVVGFTESALLLNPYGFLFAMGGSWTGMPWPSPPSTIDLDLSPGFPTPFPLTFQAIGFLGPGIGNVSNAPSIVIE